MKSTKYVSHEDMHEKIANLQQLRDSYYPLAEFIEDGCRVNSIVIHFDPNTYLQLDKSEKSMKAILEKVMEWYKGEIKRLEQEFEEL